MINLKRFVPVVILTLVMAAVFTACADNSKKSSQSTAGPAPTSSPVRDIKTDYEFDACKSFAVAVVKEKSEGPYTIGTGVLNERGLDCQELICDVLYFYNESRLKDIARLSEADTWIFSNLSVSEALGDIPINNDFRKQQREQTGRHLEVRDYIYIDWRFRDTIKEGDTILVDLGTQLWKNPNEGHNEALQHLIIEPVTVDGVLPYVALFSDGKLQLTQELESRFTLRRLYDDTEPDLTAIHNGDTVESVIEFLRIVEQDVDRYRNENPECYVNVGRPEMSVSGTELNCKAEVAAKGKRIECKLELYDFNDKLVASWAAIGSDRVAFDETVPVEFSVLYRLKISGSADGEPFAYKNARAIFGFSGEE